MSQTKPIYYGWRLIRNPEEKKDEKVKIYKSENDEEIIVTLVTKKNRHPVYSYRYGNTYAFTGIVTEFIRYDKIKYTIDEKSKPKLNIFFGWKNEKEEKYWINENGDEILVSEITKDNIPPSPNSQFVGMVKKYSKNLNKKKISRKDNFDKEELFEILNKMAQSSYKNKLWNTVGFFKSHDSNAYNRLREYMDQHISCYGHTIMTINILNKLTKLFGTRNILGVNMRYGWTPHLMNIRGMNVIATTNKKYCPSVMDSEIIDPLIAVEKYCPGIDILLIESPVYETEWPYNSLKKFRKLGGKYLIYFGEMNGCHADSYFFNELEKNWTEIKTNCDLYSWIFLRTVFKVYQIK